MKIIRCITENTEALFDNDFPDIKIEEDSKIALHSCSFDILENVITIDGANDTFTYNLTNSTPANEKQIVLEHKEYTNQNFNDLLDDMTLKMNNSLQFEGKALGTQFLNFIGEKTKKTEIGFKFSPQQTANFFDSVVNVNQGAAFIRKSTDVNSQDDSSRISASAELIKGCGRFQVRLRKINASGGVGNFKGLSVGLTETPPSQQTNNITYTHKIKVRDPTQNYTFSINDGVNQDTGIPLGQADPAQLGTNDIIEFAIFEGKLQMRIYRATEANFDLIYEEPLDRDKSYYPVLSFQGKSSAVEANTIRFHYDPWAYEKNNTVSHTGINDPIDDYTGFTARPPNVSRNTNTIFNLTLNQSLIEFLGFNQLINLKRGVEVQIIGDNLFKATLLNDSFVVEMLSENLESYDATGSNGKRRNILAVVPRNDNEGFVEYEPNTPYFIDLSNKNTKNIRNVRARILRSDLAGINISGIAILTLLIKNKNE